MSLIILGILVIIRSQKTLSFHCQYVSSFLIFFCAKCLLICVSLPVFRGEQPPSFVKVETSNAADLVIPNNKRKYRTQMSFCFPAGIVSNLIFFNQEKKNIS